MTEAAPAQPEPTTTTRRESGAQRTQRLRVVSPLAPQTPVKRGRGKRWIACDFADGAPSILQFSEREWRRLTQGVFKG